MTEQKKFARPTIERLPLYYRELQNLESLGRAEISSIELSKILGIKPEQIRKDLTEFGNFGIKGLGYNVRTLKNKIGQILGLNEDWRAAIIGVGNLGAALAHYEKISELGFVVAALFDIDQSKIGTEINGVRVYDFKKFNSISRRKLIDIGILTVPEDVAQDVANVLAEAQVRGIWNFTSVKLEVPYYVTVENLDLSISLNVLSFYMKQNY